VGFPFSSFIGPFAPDILAQKLERLAAFLGLSAAALALTGACKFPPVAALYLALPAADNPPSGFLSFLVITTDGFFFILKFFYLVELV
jgi:hypothetical protein